jgi:hypothetical protein
MYALRPGLDELLCFAWLARLKRETKRAVLVVCRVVSAGCCCCVTGTVLLVRDGVGHCGGRVVTADESRWEIIMRFIASVSQDGQVVAGLLR